MKIILGYLTNTINNYIPLPHPSNSFYYSCMLAAIIAMTV